MSVNSGALRPPIAAVASHAVTALGGLLARRALPRAIVLAARLDVRGQLAGLRGHATVELFFAFDDAASAVALLDLGERLADRDVRLVLLPVVRRGIAGDPAADAKRRYAIADARRLAARAGLALGRTQPL